MMNLRLLLLLCLFSLKSFATVSDTIHVSHYNISMDTMIYSVFQIKGMTELTVHAKLNNVNNISLGLYFLNVDSVTSGGSQLTYAYDDTTIYIVPPALMNAGDSVVLQ